MMDINIENLPDKCPICGSEWLECRINLVYYKQPSRYNNAIEVSCNECMATDTEARWIKAMKEKNCEIYCKYAGC